MKILVKRQMALGDVLCATPIIRRLREEYPDSEIFVQTNYQALFEANPHINGVNVPAQDYDNFIDLDMAHETRRAIHAIDAYMEVAFGDYGDAHTNKDIVYTPREELRVVDKSYKCITIHPNASWQNRTMPNNWWDQLVKGLNAEGYLVVVLGTHIDYLPQGRVIDTRSKLNIKQQCSMIEQSAAFVCGASGLFILAGATHTPTIVPMTINTPETCLPWRQNVLGLGFFPLNADVPCFGCNAEQGAVTFVGCRSSKKDQALGDYACIKTIDVNQAIEIALREAGCRARY